MKLFKYIGILSLICFTFFYTDKIIDVAIMHDEIMVDIKNNMDNYYVEPKDAIINGDYITPGKVGTKVDIDKSYKDMKRLGYYDESLLSYESIYPEVSIFNSKKYIISGYPYSKKISLIYIVNNKSYNNILHISNDKKIIMNFFIDANYLNNNINIIDYMNNHRIYNYGNNGEYSKDNIIFLNNINDNKMLSIMPTVNGNYNYIKNNIGNGSIIVINNPYELERIIDYIISKGYKIVPLDEIIKES